MTPKVVAVQPFEATLPRQVLDIIDKQRSNLFAWRGQFSPQLVETLLRAYAPPDATVLDPFMGSGTVLVEAAALGHDVHGCEVNPAAYSMARLYEFCNVPVDERSQILARTEALLRAEMPNELPLLADPAVATSGSASERVLRVLREHDDRHVRILLEATVVLVDPGSENDDSALFASWKRVKTAVRAFPYATRPVGAHLSDARSLPLQPGTVGFVLSSPPYINVFNYHHHYRTSVELLGWEPLQVARSEIGANRKFRQNRFLTVVQYCIDMAQVLAELNRVCTHDGRVILVVGRESNVQMTPFFNSAIVASIAASVCGFDVVCRQERVFQNRFGQNIFEDLLHLTPRGLSAPTQTHADITVAARCHGTDVLREARTRVPKERLPVLEQAIQDSPTVHPSPIAVPRHLRASHHSIHA